MTQIEYVKIKDLTLLDNNPRKITKDQFEKLCKSLTDDKEFFDCRPCLVNRKDGKLTVYAGNQRVRAAKKLKWSEVPCIIVDDLPEEIQCRRVVIDNIQHGEFDFDILAQEFNMDELIDIGMEAKDFGIFDEPMDESCKKEKKTKVVTCPGCGLEF